MKLLPCRCVWRQCQAHARGLLGPGGSTRPSATHPPSRWLPAARRLQVHPHRRLRAAAAHPHDQLQLPPTPAGAPLEGARPAPDHHTATGVPLGHGPPLPSRHGGRTGARLHSAAHRPLPPHPAQGPSFSVEGWRITWQQWDIRAGFNAREGLVLYNVGYHDPQQVRAWLGRQQWQGRRGYPVFVLDCRATAALYCTAPAAIERIDPWGCWWLQGRRRPILHRASIVEMSVPYGDPRTPYNRKRCGGRATRSAASPPPPGGCSAPGQAFFWAAAPAASPATAGAGLIPALLRLCLQCL